MYQEWYATEFFSQYAPFQDWVTGQMVKSINFYDAWMLILNLSQTQEAQVKVTFFYEDEDPKDFEFTLPAGRQGRLHLQDDIDNLGTKNLPPGCNPYKRFGMRVLSTAPVIVQATVGDRIGDERVTNSMSTFLFHPGPLSDQETQWYYVDCVYITSPKFKLEEREWITILNPNKSEAHCWITFIPGGDVDVQGKQTKPANAVLKPAEFTLNVPAERIKCTELSTVPVVQPNTPYAVCVQSDLPITVQGVRHIFERGKYEFSRCWAVLDAMPIRKPD